MNITSKLFSGKGNWDLFPLDEGIFRKAQQNSQTCGIPHKRWSLYCQSLAVFAFIEWLDYRAPSLIIKSENSSIFQPAFAHWVDAVCFLQVGEFKVCILPNKMLGDPEWILPKAVYDIPELTAHIYILVGLDETEAVGTIQGFLRYDQLHDLTSANTPDNNWNYVLSISDINTQVRDLLILLRCIDPAMIPLPGKEVVSIPENKIILKKIPQCLNNPSEIPWDWKEYVAILIDSSLQEWIYTQIQNAGLHLSLPEDNLEKQTTTLSKLWSWILTQGLEVSDTISLYQGWKKESSITTFVTRDNNDKVKYDIPLEHAVFISKSVQFHDLNFKIMMLISLLENERFKIEITIESYQLKDKHFKCEIFDNKGKVFQKINNDLAFRSFSAAPNESFNLILEYAGKEYTERFKV